MKYSIILAMLILTGCNVEKWNIAEAEESCTTYGFQLGTEAYANCVMKTKQYIETRNMNSQMIISNGLLENRTTNHQQTGVTCAPAPSTTINNKNPPVYNCR
jgi:hypothetical protein